MIYSGACGILSGKFAQVLEDNLFSKGMDSLVSGGINIPFPQWDVHMTGNPHSWGIQKRGPAHLA